MLIEVKVHAPYDLEVARPGDAAFDLRFQSPWSYTLTPGSRGVLPTGVYVEIPEGYAGFVLPRSGLAARSGITITNAPGLIDSGYRGELKVILQNTDTQFPHTIEPNERIAQFMIVPVPQVAFSMVESQDELSSSERGAQGFGSTGVA